MQQRSNIASFLLTLAGIAIAFGHLAYPAVRDGRVDTSFLLLNNSMQSGFRVNKIVPLPSGKILVAGGFSTISGGLSMGIARLNQNGSFDASFRGEAGSDVNTVFPLSDGKILISGDFLQYGGVPRNHIARLDSDGSLDQTFNPDVGSGFVQIVAVQADGKVIINGTFQSINGVARNGMARLNPDGSVDLTFEPGAGTNQTFSKAALQPDGKIIIAGRFTSYNSVPLKGIARLNSDGSLDTSFSSSRFNDHSPEVFDISLSSDGNRICLAADYYESKFIILTSDGSVDTTFNSGSSSNTGRVYSILAQPDGKILIGTESGSIFRFNPNGSVDQGFQVNVGNASSLGGVRSLAVHSADSILIGGGFTQVNGLTRGGIARIHFNGGLDTSFVGYVGSPSFIYSSYIYPDDSMLLGGDFDEVNGFFSRYAARVDKEAQVDESFLTDPGVNSRINAIAVQPDGRIVLGGPADNFFQLRRGLWRVNSDGSIDSSFNALISSSTGVGAIEILPDGKILICGSFTIVNGVSQRGLARLHSDGTLDTSFQPNFSTLGLSAIAVQPDGKIIVGGTFTHLNGVPFVGNIVRLNADGTVDTSFNAGVGANNAVTALALRDDGGIYVGGSFTQFNQQPRRSIVRLHSDGTIDPAFKSSRLSSIVFSIVEQSDKKILLGGTVKSDINAAPRSGVVRLFEDGTIDYSFDVSGVTRNGTTGEVYDLGLQSDGKIIASGQFDSINGKAQWGITRLLNFDDPTRTPYDYDGDGKADLSIFRSSNQTWYIKRSQLPSGLSILLGTPTDKIAPCDYDGDYLSDQAVYRPSDGGWFVYFAQSNTTETLKLVSPGGMPVPADFDGDGKCDAGVFRPSEGTWQIQQSREGAVTMQLGTFGDLPVVGDYDGDGRADIAIYRPLTGEWIIQQSGNGSSTSAFGNSTDWAVPADYDGDGITDKAVFRPSDAMWHVSYSGSGTQGLIQHGLPLDVPVPGDYDGDGIADIAVFRPSDRTWHISQSSGGLAQNEFGNVGDTAVLSPLVNRAVLATISGRVLTPGGSGLRNAMVTLTDSRNIKRSVPTSSLGYYSFTDVVGASYNITVASKRYRFEANSVQVNQELLNIDFAGLE